MVETGTNHLDLALSTSPVSDPVGESSALWNLCNAWRDLAREYMERQEQVWAERHAGPFPKFKDRRTYYTRGSRLAWINEHLQQAQLDTIESTKELEIEQVWIFTRWLTGLNPYNGAEDGDASEVQADRWNAIKDWMFWEEDGIEFWQEDSRERAREKRAERVKELEAGNHGFTFVERVDETTIIADTDLGTQAWVKSARSVRRRRVCISCGQVVVKQPMYHTEDLFVANQAERVCLECAKHG